MAAAGDERTDFESAIAMLQPYVSSGRFKPFDGATELSPECARSLRGAIRRATRCM
jgi:ribosomal protein S18